MRQPLPTTAVRKVAVIAHSARALLRFRGGLMRELVARRHRVLALAPDVDATAITRLEAMGVQAAAFPLEPQSAGPFALRRTERALGDALRDFGPHIVVASGPRAAALGTTIGRASGAGRVVLVVNGLSALGLDGEPAHTGWLTGGGARRRRKAGIAAADIVVFHNSEDPRTLIADGLMPADKPRLVTAGSGIDLAHYTNEPLPPLAGGLVFLMLARLESRQGVLAFAEAASTVKPKANAARFVLAALPGRGADAVAPAQIARHDAVELVPAADDVRPLIAAAHVVVHPSAGEGLPGPLLEALAMGRPVIASDTPGSRQTVDERVNGVLVPPGDAGALAAAMESYLRRPDLIPAMARASRAKAERLFDERTVIAQMLGALGIA